MEDWARRYKRASYAKRKRVLHDFVESFGEEIYRSGGNPSRVEEVFRIYDNIAGAIAGSGELIQGYALGSQWLRHAMAQIVPTGSCEQCFMNLGWDMNEALHPRSSSVTTIEVIEVIGAKVRLLLQPTSKFPFGSRWESRTGGKIWERVNEPDNNGEMAFVRDEVGKNGVYYFAWYIVNGMKRREDLEA